MLEKFKSTNFRSVNRGYATRSTVTVTDNVNTLDVALQPKNSRWCTRTAQPNTNRGTGFINVSATVDGDGFADEYQVGKVVQIKDLSREPRTR